MILSPISGNPGILLTQQEAEILLSCFAETLEALEDWEFEIRTGFPKDVVQSTGERFTALVRQLRNPVD